MIKQIFTRLITKILMLSAIVLISIGLIYEHLSLDAINKLKDGYAVVKLINGRPTYHFTEAKPKSWASLKEINLKAAHAIVVSEDWEYYHHKGVDLKQIQEAVLNSILLARPVRGASTITQQVIKNLFLTNERSLSRKIQETLIALYMEKMLSKKKILEIYLNIIEYGEGLYGIKVAAQHYFQKSPDQLSAREGAFLAMILPSPVKYSISFRQKELTPFAKKIITSILNKMVVIKYINHSESVAEQDRKFSWEKI